MSEVGVVPLPPRSGSSNDPRGPSSDAMPGKTVDTYFGLLYTMGDYAVYGYQTNTRIRFVLCLALSEAPTRDLDVKTVS